MAPRAASRSCSRSAASSARGSWFRAVPGAPARHGRRHVCRPSAARRGRAPRPAGGPASRAPPGRPGPARAGRRRRERERGAQATGRHPHVVQLLGVLAQPGARLLVAEHGELAAQHGVGQLAHGRVLGRSRWGRDRAGRGSPGRGPAGRPRTWRAWPAGARRSARSWSTIGSSASSHSGRTSTSTRRSCMGRCPFPTTIMVSSSAISAASTPPMRSAKGRRRVRTWSTSRSRCVPTMARRRRPPGRRAQRAQARRGQDLGHLEALAQPAPLRGAGVLEGDFVVAAAPAGADDEAGAGDAPVVRVEVRVDQAPRRAGQRGDGPAVGRLDGEGGQGGQPPLDRPQVERVELPLDLDGVVLARSVSAWNRTPRSGYCGSRR